MIPDNRKKQSDFESEALPHLDDIYRFAMYLSGNDDMAQDLVQETYLKAFKFFSTFERGTNCKAWLFQILKNSFLNRYRRSRRQPDSMHLETISNFYPLFQDEDEIAHNNLDYQFEHHMMNDDISHAIESLPDDYRTVVILCDIEGMQYDEIAEFTSCPIGTVRSRIHRARKILHNKLLGYARRHGYAPVPQLSE
jgi:RNA polymerase sigma-70 factor (ECF subfamily)